MEKQVAFPKMSFSKEVRLTSRKFFTCAVIPGVSSAERAAFRIIIEFILPFRHIPALQQDPLNPTLHFSDVR